MVADEICWPQKLRYGASLPCYANNEQGGKIMSANRYIRFVELSSGLIRDSRIPLFSSKFSKKTFTHTSYSFFFSWKSACPKITGTQWNLPKSWNHSERRSTLMKFPISLRSINSVNGFDLQHSPGYSTGSLNSSTTGVKRSLAQRSIRRVLPAHMPVHIIPGGPEKLENDSWKPLFQSILIDRLLPGSRSPSNRSMISLMRKNSLFNVTERESLRPTSSIKDMTRKIFTDWFEMIWTLTRLSWSEPENGNGYSASIVENSPGLSTKPGLST
jgi:hypothetical protein